MSSVCLGLLLIATCSIASSWQQLGAGTPPRGVPRPKVNVSDDDTFATPTSMYLSTNSSISLSLINPPLNQRSRGVTENPMIPSKVEPTPTHDIHEPCDWTTESPTLGAYQETSDTSLFVRACRCNNRKACVKETLSRDSGIDLCLRVLSTRYHFAAITRLTLGAESCTVVMIENYVQVTNATIVQVCNERMCTISVALPPQPSSQRYLRIRNVSGVVALNPTRAGRLRRLEVNHTFELVPFYISIDIDPLNQMEVTQGDDSAVIDVVLEQKLILLLWILLGMLSFVALVVFFAHIGRETAAESTNKQ